MALSQTSKWDHALSFPQLTVHKIHEIANFLSKDKFNRKSEIYSLDHLFKFQIKCLSHKITNQGALCGF